MVRSSLLLLALGTQALSATSAEHRDQLLWGAENATQQWEDISMMETEARARGLWDAIKRDAKKFGGFVSKTVPDHIKAAADKIGHDVVHVVHDFKHVDNSLNTHIRTDFHKFEGDVKDEAHKLGHEVQGVVGSIGDDLKKVAHDTSHGFDKFREEVHKVTDKLGRFGRALGSLGVGLLHSAEDHLRFFGDILQCIEKEAHADYYLCKLAIGNVCDCSKGSKIIVDFDPGEIGLTCVAPIGLNAGLQLHNNGSHNFVAKEVGEWELPGVSETKEAPPGTAAPTFDRSAMRPVMAEAPQGSCTGHLNVGVEGSASLVPTFSLTTTFEGHTHLMFNTTAHVSVGAMLSAEGDCDFKATKLLPEKPKEFVACADIGCIFIYLQAEVDLELFGTLSGVVDASAQASWSLEVDATLDPIKGQASISAKVSPLSVFAGVHAGASMYTSAKLTAGPILTVLPMPGIPVDFHPTFSAEVKGYGEVSYTTNVSKSITVFLDESEGKVISQKEESGGSVSTATVRGQDKVEAQVQADGTMLWTTPEADAEPEVLTEFAQPANVQSQFQGCAAVAVNVMTKSEIAGVGLPPQLLQVATFSSDTVRQALVDDAKSTVAQITDVAQLVLNVSSCFDSIPLVKDIVTEGDKIVNTVKHVADEAVDKVGEVIGDIIPHIDFGKLTANDNKLLWSGLNYCGTLWEVGSDEQCREAVKCGGSAGAKTPETTAPAGAPAATTTAAPAGSAARDLSPHRGWPQPQPFPQAQYTGFEESIVRDTSADDSCGWRKNGICDERDDHRTLCVEGTDCSDCGRCHMSHVPLQCRDHLGYCESIKEFCPHYKWIQRACAETCETCSR
mmetsp:Transcript_26930/g.60785  ORF Transcript_26930/g.60785 Transcript_26930/m.60785 type:complete len:842 (-) Transcript_26930:187-2712(-)